MSILQHHLATRVCCQVGDFIQRKSMVLTDGTVFSVQAGRGLYSNPRANVGPYTEVEVATFGKVDAFDGLCDAGSGDFLVYAYVPVDLVELEIARRGGILGVRDGMGGPEDSPRRTRSGLWTVRGRRYRTKRLALRSVVEPIT